MKFKDVTFAFDGAGADAPKTMFERFNAEFEDGKISCIFGPSGCGKTTLLNLAAGLLRPQSGVIEGAGGTGAGAAGGNGGINGVSGAGAAGRVSYVFQDARLIPQLTAFENFAFVLRGVFDKKKIKALADEYFKAAELDGARAEYPGKLSGGMRRRLSLIRAFAYPSRLLLMDEPFASLDAELRGKLTGLFLSLWERERRTVLFVTHDAGDAARLSADAYAFADASPASGLKRV